MRHSKAFCLIRERPVYRRDAFFDGLRAVGFDPRTEVPQTFEAGDALVLWNRYGAHHDLACRAEQAGAIVLVAENGYIGPKGLSPHDTLPREIYALALGGHNGQGAWHVGGPERWEALNIKLQPWREDGEHILVCPNRSFGRPGYIMPPDWAQGVAKRLQRVTGRPVRVRAHPGNDAPKTPLAQDLEGCWTCVIWSSSAGVQALIAGVPVICEAPAWICKGATFDSSTNSDVHMPDPTCRVRRRAALEALAWAQWHVAEIASGEPFRQLLRP